jgi:uncharacterized protein (DUF58 family)
VDFGTANTLKRNMLIDFVGTMARLFTRHGNRVGAVLYDSQVQLVIPAAGGRPQVLRIVNDLLRQPQLPRAPLTNLSTLLEAAYRAVKRRALVFVVSDFISAPGWDKALGLLAQRHEVLCVRLIDRLESELPNIGGVVIEDSETGEQLYIDTNDRRFRERFHKAAEEREYNLNLIFKRVGTDLLTLSTEDDLVSSIVRFANVRRQRKRVA